MQQNQGLYTVISVSEIFGYKEPSLKNFSVEQIKLLIADKKIKGYPNRTLLLPDDEVNHDLAEISVSFRCHNSHCNRKLRFEKLLSECSGEFLVQREDHR